MAIEDITSEAAEIPSDFVLDALLMHNYFPNQKELREDLPPSISPKFFTRDVSKKLIDCKENRVKSMGYDSVEYKLTRFNGVSRNCSIPHPKAYAQLAWCIYENWNELDYIVKNTVSKIVPRNHSDGRIIIMDYEDGLTTIDRSLKEIFGMHFMARTDIANFYPSVYTHAIPWAVVGIENAKANKGKKELWYNQFDQAVQLNKRNETLGISIGPATSNFIAESILAKIDNELSSEFTYSRYLDDYTAYCETHEQAEKFILRLGGELSKFKLNLNIGKTDIITLPQPFLPNWIVALRNALPQHKDLNAQNAIDYLEFAVRLAKETPDGSVLKYALRALTGVIEKSETEWWVKDRVIKYSLALSFHQPVLLPLLNSLIDETFLFDHNDFQKLIAEFARRGYSDILTWTLYLADKHSISINSSNANDILATKDCIPILFLYLSGDNEQKKAVIDFARGLNKKDLYTLDQYWLLLYQLYLEGKISNPYGKKSSFDVLRDEGVSFVISEATAE